MAEDVATTEETVRVALPLLRMRSLACVCAVVLGKSGSPVWNMARVRTLGAITAGAAARAGALTSATTIIASTNDLSNNIRVVVDPS